mmetsp:Transcript_21263/g.49325  ORF Transcript_21263/g.49325 Transcript_21263/m.49325 type:complete len:328 (+) Transcript_21263:708-1691(+)
MKGVVVPQHDAVGRQRDAVRQDEPIWISEFAAADLERMGGVHNQECPEDTLAACLKTQSVVAPGWWVGVVGCELPHVLPHTQSRFLLCARDDAPGGKRNIFGGHILHARGDLRDEALVKVVDEWVHGNVVLEPWHNHHHHTAPPGTLNHPMPKYLSDKGNQQVSDMGEDKRSIGVWPQRRVAATQPHVAAAAEEQAQHEEGQAEEIVHEGVQAEGKERQKHIDGHKREAEEKEAAATARDLIRWRFEEGTPASRQDAHGQRAEKDEEDEQWCLDQQPHPAGDVDVAVADAKGLVDSPLLVHCCVRLLGLQLPSVLHLRPRLAIDLLV